MEPALKQRLLGAVVLIALAIIFVPMFLGGSGEQPGSTTIDMQIPPQPERDFETRMLPVDPTPAAPTPAKDPAPVTREPVASIDTATAPPVAPPPAAVTEPVPATPPQAAPPAAVETKPAAPEPTPVAAGQAAIGNYLVHLGVYAEAGNAQELVAALKRAGFPAFQEPVDMKGKPARRVRVGPYTDRAEAEAARIRIKQIRADVPGSVVATSTDISRDQAQTAATTARAGGWAVQLGAFGAEADAKALAKRLQGAGFTSFVDPIATEGKTLWRVRAGPEVDRSKADTLRNRIKEKLKLDGLVVTQP